MMSGNKYASNLKPLLLLLMLILSCTVFAQDATLEKKRITLVASNKPLSNVLDSIGHKAGLFIIYSSNKLNRKETVSVYAYGENVNTILNDLIGKKGFYWTLKGNILSIYSIGEKPPENVSASPGSPLNKKTILSGVVTDNADIILIGATVRIKGTSVGCATDSRGEFRLETILVAPVLEISYTGYSTVLFPVTDTKPTIIIKLFPSPQGLDEIIHTTYSATSRRLSTSNTTIITSEEIMRHPVGNPLEALVGRIPGLYIVPSSGIIGASIKIQIRGRNSLINGSDPLFIIDGVPFAPGNQQINLLNSIASQNINGGITALTSINMADIANIQILKDADATSIYGSRGANGVILINTKRGEPGKTRVTADVMSGISYVANIPAFMNTSEYLQMRKEAFDNDGISSDDYPTDGTASDLVKWDKTRYTDWPKKLLGGYANITGANISVSLDTINTQLLLGIGLYRQTGVFPSKTSYLRGSLHFSANTLISKKIRTGVAFIYSIDANNLFNASLTPIVTAPNAPGLYNDNGSLNWFEDGSFDNPMAGFLKKYKMTKQNMNINGNLQYDINDHFYLKSSIGYNGMGVNENSILPISAQNPFHSTLLTGSYLFATNALKSYVVESVGGYNLKTSNNNLTALLGGSYQYTRINTSSIAGEGYTSDEFLNSINGAAAISNKTSDIIKYKYGSLFGQVTYNICDKYVVNISGRGDGSSRFSPEKRFSALGAIGSAWIFSNEDFIKKMIPFLTYGKLRGSYGITGNDQIGNYKYLDTWSASLLNPYQGGLAIAPDALYNKGYYWEKSKKLEVSVELQLFKDRLFIATTFFRNRNGNQLVNSPLPAQTGFNSILQNFDATIENRGWEIQISDSLIRQPTFKLTASLNVTIPQNKLLRFKHLSSTYYNETFVIGESVNVLKKFKSLGVDPNSGIFMLADTDGKSGYTVDDSKVIGDLDPDYYGGVQLSVQTGRFAIDILGDFKKQMAPNYLYAVYVNNLLPGMMYNQLDILKDRWRKAGDDAVYPGVSTDPNSKFYSDKNYVVSSQEAYTKAGYFKLRNIAATYSINNSKLKETGFESLKINCKIQNVFTITRYKEGDPEIGTPFSLPTLRTFTIGIQATF
jgi:TonB-linked SusC/RagA family outer membrane protein